MLVTWKPIIDAQAANQLEHRKFHYRTTESAKRLNERKNMKVKIKKRNRKSEKANEWKTKVRQGQKTSHLRLKLPRRRQHQDNRAQQNRPTSSRTKSPCASSDDVLRRCVLSILSTHLKCIIKQLVVSSMQRDQSNLLLHTFPCMVSTVSQIKAPQQEVHSCSTLRINAKDTNQSSKTFNYWTQSQITLDLFVSEWCHFWERVTGSYLTRERPKCTQKRDLERQKLNIDSFILRQLCNLHRL